MRTRRLLLAASALSTLAFGCSQDKPDKGVTQELPGNPKGTFYDAGLATPDPDIRPLPGNPKGTVYDAGIAPTLPDAPITDAGARVRDPGRRSPLKSDKSNPGP